MASSGPHLIGFKLPRVNISCTHVTTNEVICDAVIGSLDTRYVVTNQRISTFLSECAREHAIRNYLSLRTLTIRDKFARHYLFARENCVRNIRNQQREDDCENTSDGEPNIYVNFPVV